MAKFVGLFVLFLSMPLSMPLSAEQALRFGLRTGLPATYYTETIPPKGVLPELISAVLDPLDTELEYQIIPRRRIIHQLLAGDLHMTTLPVALDLVGKMQWPEGLVVSTEPLLTYDVNLYKLSTSDLQITDRSDISGLLLGSTRHPKFMINAMQAYFVVDFEIELFNKSESMLKALLSKRVDIILLSDPELLGLLRSFPESTPIEKVYPLGVVQTHLVVSQAAFGHEEAIKHARFIDERILQMHQQGQIQAVVNQYNLPLRSEH